MSAFYDVKLTQFQGEKQHLEALITEYSEISSCLKTATDPVTISRFKSKQINHLKEMTALADFCDRLEKELEELKITEKIVLVVPNEREDFFVTLTEILTIYEDSITPCIEKAYIVSAKLTDSPRSIPMTLIGKLTDLNQMQPDRGCSALLKFAAYLIDQEQIPEMLSTRLMAWAERQISTFSQILQQVRKSNLANQRHRQSYLMIKVEPTFAGKQQPENHYAVKAWFIADEQKYHAESGIGVVPLSTVENEDFTDTEELFTIAETEKLVSVFIYNSARCGLLPNLIVELFLPDELLNESVDSWKMDDGDSVFPIGSKYKVILRSTQRLHKRQFMLSRSYWQQKWNNMPEPKAKQSTGLLVAGDNMSYECLFQELEPAHIMGLTFVENSLQIGKNSPVAALRSAGAPIAMWLRQPLPNVDQTTINSLLACCLHDLPSVVKQQRLAALSQAPGSHIGHHLALLWDSFDRLPPDLDFYMS